MTDDIIGTCNACHHEVYTNEYIDPCAADDCNALCHMNCTKCYEYCDECEQPICSKHCVIYDETTLCPTCAKKAIANAKRAAITACLLASI